MMAQTKTLYTIFNFRVKVMGDLFGRTFQYNACKVNGKRQITIIMPWTTKTRDSMS